MTAQSENMPHTLTTPIRNILLALAFMLVSTPALASEPLLAVTLKAPPMVIQTTDGITGMAAELALAGLRRAGFSPLIELVPWKRAVHMAQIGEADVLFYAVHTKERERFFHYPKTPLFTVEIVALKRAKTQVIVNPDFQGLSRWVLGAGRGFAYGPKVERFIDRAQFKRIEIAASNDINFNKLLGNRVDLILVDRALARWYMESPETKGTAELVTDSEGNVAVFDSMDAYLIFSRKTRTAKDAARFSKALESIRQDGSYQAIIDRYQ